MILAAGILFQLPDGRVLLLQRSDVGDHGGEWATPGGKIEDGESAEQAAVRECRDELGIDPDKIGTGFRHLHTRRHSEDVDYTTFLQRAPTEFTPTLNDEHVGFGWFAPKDVTGE